MKGGGKRQGAGSSEEDDEKISYEKMRVIHVREER